VWPEAAGLSLDIWRVCAVMGVFVGIDNIVLGSTCWRHASKSESPRGQRIGDHKTQSEVSPMPLKRHKAANNRGQARIQSGTKPSQAVQQTGHLPAENLQLGLLS